MNLPPSSAIDSRRPAPSPRRRQFGVAIILAGLGLLAIRYGRAHHLTFGPRLPCLVAGAALVAAGLVLRFLAFLELRSTWHIRGLVTSGIYAHTRNPIYLSFAVIVTGLALLSRTWLAWPWVALCFVVFWMVARREEADLLRAFGEDYGRYRRSVPRFWPRL